MSKVTIEVYRPTGPASATERVTAKGLDRPWDELRFALVDNSKPGAIPLLDGIADTLGIADARRVTIAKQMAPKPLDDDERRVIQERCDVAVLAVGNCGSCCSWTCHDAVKVTADLGIPSVLVVTTPFERIGRQVATSLGYPDLPIVAVEHPVGLLPYDVVHARGAGAAAAVRDGLLRVAAGVAGDRVAGVGDDELLTVADDQAAVDALFLANWWSDGLPVVAPTRRRVSEMLGRHADRADEVVGTVATGYGSATYRAIAVNAVMAGCLPSYFDTLVAAVRAVVDPVFNLHGIQATTHPAGPMVMVNGPVVGEIGLNAGTNTFGPGYRANATIGRALRLVLQNVGGSIPGETDRATFGHPGKYTNCIAENEAESPWEPFHVSRGHAASASTVSVFGVEGPQNMNDAGSTTADGLLRTFVGCMTSVGANYHQYDRTEPFVIHSPEHAHTLAQAGHTRESLQKYYSENARVPLSAFSPEKVERFLARRRPAWFGPQNTTGYALVADHPEDFLIAVAGGPGTHSVLVPTFGPTKAVTVEIDMP